jgi:hypothetical protein
MRKLFILMLLAVSWGCCEDKHCPKLSSSDKAWIPYKTGDTLRFKSNLTDSIVTYTVEWVKDETKQVAKPESYCNRICVDVKTVQFRLVTDDFRYQLVSTYMQGKVLVSDKKPLIRYGAGNMVENYPSYAFSPLDETPVTQEINGRTYHEVYIEQRDVSETVFEYTFETVGFNKTKGLLFFKQAGFDDIYEILND